MPIPDEFKTLCRHFHQDMSFCTPQLEAAVAAVVSGLTHDERNVVHKFLAELLNEFHDNSELKRVWRHSGAQLLLSGTRGVRPLFLLIRDEIELKR